MRDITVLFVDDEMRILASLKRNLIKEPYKQVFAINGEDALKILANEPVHVIVSDLKMPKLDGLQLLRHVKDQYPDIVRIVLTGFVHVSQIIPCINTGEVYRYITKPLEPAEFKITLRDAIEYYLLRKDRLELVQRLEQQNKELEIALAERKQVEEHLKRLSLLDELTSIPNRRNFNEVIKQEWQRARRNRYPLSLIMLDLDSFKTYNDNYGHPAGDECLRKVAEAFRAVLKRPGDMIARYGGEEFAAILPDTENEGAIKVANDMLKSLELLAIPHNSSPVNQYVTTSAGVATKTPSLGLADSYKKLILQADKALYKAKESGKNKVINACILKETVTL